MLLDHGAVVYTEDELRHPLMLTCVGGPNDGEEWEVLGTHDAPATQLKIPSIYQMTHGTKLRVLSRYDVMTRERGPAIIDAVLLYMGEWIG